MDSKSYYYGFGYGILSSKVPERFTMYFGGSDLGNRGVIIKENFLNLNMFYKGSKFVEITDKKEKVFIKDFDGYWFNNKLIIVKFKDNDNKQRFLKIYEEVSNDLHPKINIEEMKYAPLDDYDLKYIDLNLDLSYLKRYRLFKNLLGFILIIVTFFKAKRIYNNL
ncbi:hypothetical protein B6A10_16180 [Flavobacterium sp. L1I52]|uniref:Uncharacterized protein n=2 Tax=Flavobacterium pokkalii TaxID=1940408 RepID=A0ABR7UYY0_9FLAO|nr:hypothetical protein [Flavobacterium pokkalii]